MNTEQALRWVLDKQHEISCKKRAYPKAIDKEPCTCGRNDAVAIIRELERAEERLARVAELAASWKALTELRRSNRKVNSLPAIEARTEALEQCASDLAAILTETTVSTAPTGERETNG